MRVTRACERLKTLVGHRSLDAPELERALEGTTPGGQRLRPGFGLSQDGLSGGIKALKSHPRA
jgi:hypothetical protein